MKCPGQDTRYWKADAIFEVPCPSCGKPIEFFKDESTRRCKKCGHKLRNPHLNLGCAEWCSYGDQCLAQSGVSPADNTKAAKPPQPIEKIEPGDTENTEKA